MGITCLGTAGRGPEGGAPLPTAGFLRVLSRLSSAPGSGLGSGRESEGEEAGGVREEELEELEAPEWGRPTGREAGCTGVADGRPVDGTWRRGGAGAEAAEEGSEGRRMGTALTEVREEGGSGLSSWLG